MTNADTVGLEVAESLLLAAALQSCIGRSVQDVTALSISEATMIPPEKIVACLGGDVEIRLKVLALAVREGHEIRILALSGGTIESGNVQKRRRRDRTARRRLPPEARKEEILVAALQAARDVGYRRVTRKLIAERAETSDALVSKRLGSAGTIPEVIMRQAVDRRDLEVIAQGLVNHDPIAMAASDELRAESMRELAGSSLGVIGK